MHRLDWRYAGAAIAAVVVTVVAFAIFRGPDSNVVVTGPLDDRDGDAVADAEDNCADAPNADQVDADGDGVGDLCDDDPQDGPDGDVDSDGVVNRLDNCELVANAAQADADGDGSGDECDPVDDRSVEPDPGDDVASGDGAGDDGGQDDSALPSPSPEEPTPSPPSPDPPQSSAVSPAVTTGQGCILSLHGAGTAPPSEFNLWGEGIWFLKPHSGNTTFPYFWLYDGPHNEALDPGDDQQPYDDLVAYLRGVLDDHDCGPTLLYGASNGGGFAAKLYCKGEDFDGRVWGVIVDDPVPDAGVVGCSPSPNVQRSMFVHSTEVITEAERFVDNRCSQSPTLEFTWYCEDDTGFDLAEYEAHIGQESLWGRENHLGVNNDETNFWNIVLRWWYEYDPVTYAHLESR